MRFQPSLEVVPGQFVGRSAEEAVERARATLGTDAKVRCWKTRTGGVLGFFAQEIFVAGINVPGGKVATADRPAESKKRTKPIDRPSIPTKKQAKSVEPSTPESKKPTKPVEPSMLESKKRTKLVKSSPFESIKRSKLAKPSPFQSMKRTKPDESTPTPSTSVESMPVGLDDLVSSTNDEVSFQSSEYVDTEHEFHDVLAQAEAALNEVVFDDAEWSDDETLDTAPMDATPPRDEMEEFRDSLGTPRAARVVPAARARKRARRTGEVAARLTTTGRTTDDTWIGHRRGRFAPRGGDGGARDCRAS